MTETYRLHTEPQTEISTVRYIKLGEGGDWARDCFDRGLIAVGFPDIPHEVAEAGDWDGVRSRYIECGRTAGVAENFTRQLRDFYTQGTDCIWITFAEGKVFWARAEPEVTPSGDDPTIGGARYRRVIDQWRSTDLSGAPLSIRSISSQLTSTGSYQQTICEVKAAAYAMRLINAEESPAVASARDAQDRFAERLLPLIQSLHHKDFETLVDLIFSRLGWRRTSKVGDELVDIDLIVEQPVSRRVGLVQVKSRANQALIDQCVADMRQHDPDAVCFFVCHTANGKLSPAAPSANADIWTGDRLTRQVIEAGLAGWLFERAT